jgi:choline kinase
MSEGGSRRSSLHSAPPTSRSRSHSRSHSHGRSHSRSHRPSLGSRKNSAKSFKSIELEQVTPQQSVDHDTVEIPAVQATLDHTLPLEYFKQDLLSVLQQLHVSKWHRLPLHASGDITIKRMSGALTNAIYKVDPPPLAVLKNLDLQNHNFPVLLLRVYGPNVDSIIDRDYELKILVRLSMQNIGPRLFGCFTNGRIEQFLDNAITLTKQDIMNKKTSARIARRMKELHCGIKLSKSEMDEGPTSWKNIEKWLPVAKKVLSTPDLGYEEEEIVRASFEFLEQKLLEYKKWVFGRYKNVNDTLVFCHNDTQYGNLLFTTPRSSQSIQQQNPPSSQQSFATNFSNLSLENLQNIKPSQQEKKQDQHLVVIDFEYSGPNPPYFDIANHFCEWMHNYNHPTESYAVTEADFPSMDEQFNLLYSYIICNNPETDVTKLEKEAKRLYNECIAWRPTVSIFWALWAILQNGEKTHGSDAIIEQGPNGEQYKIVHEDGELSDDTVVEEEEDDSGEADVDSFEYLKYARDKLSVFWGDLIQLGIVDKTEVKKAVKNLPATMFEDLE